MGLWGVRVGEGLRKSLVFFFCFGIIDEEIDFRNGFIFV